MKKCALSLFWALALSLIFAAPALAADNTRIPYAVTGGNIYFNADTGKVVDFDETVTAVIIPAKINGVAVSGIGDMAFFRCSNLTSVTIPNSVTSVGKEAFSDCSALTSVTIGNGVTSIGERAFAGCWSLTSVVIPNSVTSVEDGVFSSCWSLTSMTIPNSVTSIGNKAFSYCWGLTSVTIPNSVTSIGAEAFGSCRTLTSVTIGNGVTSIGPDAFAFCPSLTSIAVSEGNSNYCAENGVLFNKDKTLLVQYPEGKVGAYQISDGVTSIGDGAFRECKKLKSVTLPDGVTSIGKGAFYYCDGLTSVVIPNSVTSIGKSAFDDCWRLTSVMIGNGVTSIGERAFNDCSNLMSVTLPSSVTCILYDAFWGCGQLEEIYYGGTQAQWQTMTILGGNSPLKSAKIYYNCAGSLGEAINWLCAPSQRSVSISGDIPKEETLFAVGYNSVGRMVFLKQVAEAGTVTFGDDAARVKLFYLDANFVPKCLNATICFS